MNSDPMREQIQCACTNLKIASRAAGRVWDKALSTTDVNSTQYAILRNIARHQPIANMKLAELLGMERTTLYRAVALLERQDLVSSEAAPEGRSKLLRLTSKGITVTEDARGAWEDAQARLVKKLGSQKWAEFLSTLRIIQHQLEDM